MNSVIKPIHHNGKFDLAQIAAVLEGLEETIIFTLMNRAQTAANLTVYQPGLSGFEGAGDKSLLEIRLRMHEETDSVFGRFTVPEERPFSKNLSAPKRKIQSVNTGLMIDSYDLISMTNEILPAYLKLIPEICPIEEDGHYGSSVEHDVMALQAVARRIHFGALNVAEAKYQSDPTKYRGMAETNDREGLMKALTRAEVEEHILNRVAEKVEHIQGHINPSVRRLIQPEKIMAFYRNEIIPLTKEGEIKYFLNRKYA